MIQEKLGATVWSNAMHTSVPAIMGSEEISRQQSTILERQSNGKEQEIIKVKVEMSEEIQQNSERDGIGTMLKGKEEQIRRSKRRSKLRVYLP